VKRENGCSCLTAVLDETDAATATRKDVLKRAQAEHKARQPKPKAPPPRIEPPAPDPALAPVVERKPKQAPPQELVTQVRPGNALG
jgi:hypothetical protein